MHGNTVVARHMRTDVTTLLPMDMVAAEMPTGHPQHVVIPLPHRPAPARRHGDPLHHRGGGDDDPLNACDWNPVSVDGTVTTMSLLCRRFDRRASELRLGVGAGAFGDSDSRLEIGVGRRTNLVGVMPIGLSP